MQSRAVVIVPTYNERLNIEPLLRQILDASPIVDALVVDDASPDGTGEIARKLASENPRIHVLNRIGPKGRGLAGIDGFRWALQGDYETILEMDGDFSHDPAHIPAFLERIQEADVVIGSRFVAGGKDRRRGWYRRLLSCLANAYTGAILQIPVQDRTSGFRCFKRSVLAPVVWSDMVSKGPSLVEELIYKVYRRGAAIKEIPIFFDERKSGASKLNFIRLWDVLYTLIKVRLTK